jgi:hypothetical protein
MAHFQQAVHRQSATVWAVLSSRHSFVPQGFAATSHRHRTFLRWALILGLVATSPILLWLLLIAVMSAGIAAPY